LGSQALGFFFFLSLNNWGPCIPNFLLDKTRSTWGLQTFGSFSSNVQESRAQGPQLYPCPRNKHPRF